MQSSIVTPGRLTVMLPVVPKANGMYHISDLTNELGRQLVHNILVRKGLEYIMNKSGTRLKPLAQIIFNKGMQRLASNETPETIVRDLEIQLLLIRN